MSANYELLYQSHINFNNCYELCQAHCCTNLKRHFKLLKRLPHEIYLFPGEYAYMQTHADQFQSQTAQKKYRRQSYNISYEGGLDTLVVESLISPGHTCTCVHPVRPILCRLYPFFPVFDHNLTLTSYTTLSIFDCIEQLSNVESACYIHSLSNTQWAEFKKIVELLSEDPVVLFSMCAYTTMQQFILNELKSLYKRFPNEDYFSLFEKCFTTSGLISFDPAKMALSELLNRFKKRFGSSFSLAHPQSA